MSETQPTIMAGASRWYDYLFGRNALIGLASMMLLLISGYATWSGMNDFIVGASSAAKGRDLPGGVSLSHTNLVVAVVIALTFLMWIALREAIGPQRSIMERLITFPLYIFLVLWSVGFGYGFWWSLIAGEEATRTGLTSLQEDARDAGAAIAARLDAVKVQIDSVAAWSDAQMQREESSGGSCGKTSGAGRGPLYNARRGVRDTVTSLRDGMTNAWINPVQAELENLRKTVGALEGGDPNEDRQKRFEALSSQIRGSARNIANRSNELGSANASSMRALADAVDVKPEQTGFSCYDQTLAQRLRQAADQASEPAKLQLRQAVFNEGPAGVANAVKNLWANLGAYGKSLGTYVFSGGKQTAEHTSGGEPITGRDMIALLATIGIDLGLFVLALLDPPAAAPVRRDGLAAQQARLHLPTQAVIRQLASAFQTAIARAPDANLEWVRQHFIHHNGASYFVIPNLYGVEKEGENSKKEELRALALNQLAGVLDDVKLVRALTQTELTKALDDEGRGSLSDLTRVRNEWERQVASGNTEGKPRGILRKLKSAGRVNLSTTAAVSNPADKRPVRNHGLISKTERTLDIAGWSKAAQRDVEIFRLIDTEGLTPLLSMLNEATLEKGHEMATEANAEHAQLRVPAKQAPKMLEHKQGWEVEGVRP